MHLIKLSTAFIALASVALAAPQVTIGDLNSKTNVYTEYLLGIASGRRASYGLGPVQSDARLNQVAQSKANSLAQSCSSTRTSTKSLKLSNTLPGVTVIEHSSASPEGASIVFGDFLSSPLSSTFKQSSSLNGFGFAIAVNEDCDTNKEFWVLEFAALPDIETPEGVSLGGLTTSGGLAPSSAKKGEWDFCKKSSECANNCCSKEWSDDGKLKCTPGSSKCVY